MAAEERGEQPAQQQQRVRTVRQLDTLIEQRIREAIERGAFDNLETKGKPLRLDLKDAVDREAWFVNRTMRNLGAVPAWMELGKEIDAAEARLRWMGEDFDRWLGETRAELGPLPPAAWQGRRAGVELRFEDRFARYRRLAHELHTLIERFNLQVPVRSLEKPGLWVAHELRRLREPYAALCADLGWNTDDIVEPDNPAPHTPTAGEPVAPDTLPADDEPHRGRRLLGLWRRAGDGLRRSGPRPPRG